MAFARRCTRALLGFSALVCAAAVLAWAGGLPLAAVAAVTPSASVDVLIVATATLGAWACLAWFAGVVALEIGAAVPGVAGRLCDRAVRRIAPQLMRYCARWLVGATLLASPLVATPALAASAGPNLDRPVAAAALVPGADGVVPTAPTSVPSPAPTSEPSPAPSPVPSFDSLDRPGVRFVPSPPPSVVKTTDTAGLSLLTGTPHRGLDDDTYVVHAGDALWDIAARHLGPGATPTEIAREWPRWYAANRALIGDNPAVIHPGQVLRAPAN
jgi:hypothetical protein